MDYYTIMTMLFVVAHNTQKDIWLKRLWLLSAAMSLLMAIMGK